MPLNLVLMQAKEHWERSRLPLQQPRFSAKEKSPGNEVALTRDFRYQTDENKSERLGRGWDGKGNA